MAVDYDFYETPVPGDRQKEKRLHARVVPGRTVDLEELAEIIHQRSTLSVGEIRAAIISLKEVMVESLKNGDRVHLDGLGTFEMTASCPPVRSEKEIRAESVQFKTVSFRPEKKLKKELTDTHFVRARQKKHSSITTEIEMDKLLTAYFAEHTYITRLKFEHLCGFTRSTASRKIKQLVEEGKLRKEGIYQSPVYEPAPGNYGR